MVRSLSCVLLLRAAATVLLLAASGSTAKDRPEQANTNGASPLLKEADTAASGFAIMRIDGATGPNAGLVNGLWDRQPPRAAAAGGAPDYRQRADPDRWLYRATDGRWYVGTTEWKDTRKATGWARTADPVADGTLPHEAPAGGWKVGVDINWVPQPAVAVRGVTEAEADRLNAAAAAEAAAAWARAADRAARAPVVRVDGATGNSASDVNRLYDRQPPRAAAGGERADGSTAGVGAPDYRQRADPDRWLYRATDGRWYVGTTEWKDTRKATGWARTADPVADGTLPHEAPTGGWEVGVDGKWVPQPAVAVRSVTVAEADRLDAAAAAEVAAAWARAADRAARAPVVLIDGATGPNAGTVNGMYDRQPPRAAAGRARADGSTPGVGAPDYRQRADPDRWLFRATDGKWRVSDTGDKDARKTDGWARTADPVADGTLPHEAPAGGWEVGVDEKWVPQSAVTVRGVTEAEADQTAAAWARAADRAARTPVVHVDGATGPNAGEVNGLYDLQPPRAAAGCAGADGSTAGPGAPDYRQRSDPDRWLYLTFNGRWRVGHGGNKDARKNSGWARTADPVADGTLPHEAPAGEWNVDVDRDERPTFVPQPAVTVRGVTEAEGDRLEAAAAAESAAAWARAADRIARAPVIRVDGATGDNAGTVNGLYDRQPPRAAAGGAGAEGGAPDYRQRADPDRWLFRATNGRWYVGMTRRKDTPPPPPPPPNRRRLPPTAKPLRSRAPSRPPPTHRAHKRAPPPLISAAAAAAAQRSAA